MEEILKSDIFFFVTTIAIIIVTFLLVIIGVYTIKILKDVKSVVKDIKFKYRFIQKFIKHIIK
jgi:hypothetical protein